MGAKYYFWRFSNLYGWVFGIAALAPIHRVFLNLSLHGLGYDNARHTGEEWFIANILAKANPAVCIDVGANVGAYSRMLATKTKATVYAVEPADASYAKLQQVAAKYPGRIHTYQAAISDHEGSATLYSRDALSEKATLSESDGKGSTLEQRVQLKTLDGLIKELAITKVDFIKIDTEGHELAVFTGMQETLKMLQPAYIQFEFNYVHLRSNTTLYQLSQLLPGYTFYRLLPHGWLHIDPSNMSSNIFMFSNIVAKKLHQKIYV
jgi:FkbM family methyltransferase